MDGFIKICIDYWLGLSIASVIVALPITIKVIYRSKLNIKNQNSPYISGNENKVATGGGIIAADSSIVHVTNISNHTPLVPPLSEQAKHILVQFYQIEEQDLLTALNSNGQMNHIQTNTQPLSFSDTSFISDDIETLAQYGYIRYDGPMTGGTRYVKTRNGSDFVRELLKNGYSNADA